MRRREKARLCCASSLSLSAYLNQLVRETWQRPKRDTAKKKEAEGVKQPRKKNENHLPDLEWPEECQNEKKGGVSQLFFFFCSGGRNGSRQKAINTRIRIKRPRKFPNSSQTVELHGQSARVHATPPPA